VKEQFKDSGKAKTKGKERKNSSSHELAVDSEPKWMHLHMIYEFLTLLSLFLIISSKDRVH
jgi:hypothetical protein